MQIQHRCDAKKLLQLHELVKQFNLRWMYNPYPINLNKPDSEWQVGIDFNNSSPEQTQAFEHAWQQITTPIRESTRHYSFIHQLKVACKKFFNVDYH